MYLKCARVSYAYMCGCALYDHIEGTRQLLTQAQMKSNSTRNMDHVKEREERGHSLGKSTPGYK